MSNPNNIFLFTGQGQYRLRQELARRQDSFVKKYGSEGVYTFRAGEIDATRLRDVLMGGGFFATKSLVIVHGLPKDTFYGQHASSSDQVQAEQFLMDHLDKIPSENILILVSYKPDKRTKAYKFFKKNGQLKEFKPMKDPDLMQLIQTKLGAHIAPNDISYLLSRVGSDPFHLHNECEKLLSYLTYHQKTTLSRADINEVVIARVTGDNFRIVDTLISDPRTTLTYITEAQSQGTNIFEFFGLVYRGLKMLLSMIDLHEQGITDSKELASILKIHPFAVSKQNKKIPGYIQQKHRLVDIYHQLLQLDYQIKTGQLPQESAWTMVKRIVMSGSY